MQKIHAKDLLEKYKNGTSTQEERDIVETWYDRFDVPELDNLSEQAIDESLGRIRNRLDADDSKPKVSRLWPRLVAIAAAIALIVTGVYFFNYYSPADRKADQLVQDIAPGQQGATLTLASGKKIRLSDATNGELAKEAGVSITKSADGQIIYEIASASASSRNDGAGAKTNTLSTAKGETYQVKLPDGSIVYLNSASSLTYSASLIEQGKRVVELRGEGYFEVFKDKGHPFVVKTGNQEVEVLGTHFNINSYTDEGATKTTLVEGSVKVIPLLSSRVTAKDPGATILKPGQQSILSGSNRIAVQEVNVDNITDWKDDDFVFNGDDFKSAMRKIARWYDVEIVYADDLPKNISPGGWISRNNKISAVLKMIEATGQVHFKIEGRKVLVTK